MLITRPSKFPEVGELFLRKLKEIFFQDYLGTVELRQVKREVFKFDPSSKKNAANSSFSGSYHCHTQGREEKIWRDFHRGNQFRRIFFARIFSH